jgi:hypothetical protein
MLRTAVCLLFLSAAADDAARAVIGKAVAAMDGAGKVSAAKAVRLTMKGTLYLEGGKAAVTGEMLIAFPDKLRDRTDFDVQGQSFSFLRVYDGKTGRQLGAGEDKALEGEALDEVRKSLHSARVSMPAPLLTDKEFELAALGDSRVGKADVVGVKVSRKGFPDVRLFFDKATFLLVKEEGEAKDAEKNKVLSETFHSDYKDFGGVKVAVKQRVRHGGKPFLDVEVTAFELPEQVDPAEFRPPER